MRILLTGSTGFLGRHLKARLEKEGHTLDLLGRGPSPAWTSCPHAIINCAGELDKEGEMIDTNVGLTMDLLDHALYYQVPRFIQIGSSSETGPFEGPRSEDTPCYPTTVYEKTKYSATRLCQKYSDGSGLNACVARPFSLYGPNDKPRKFIPALVRTLREGGTFDVYPGGHDWLYVDDFVEGIMNLLGQPATLTRGQVFHFGTGINTSNSDVVHLFEKVAGQSLSVYYHHEKYRPYDVLDWRADWSKAERLLGWKPTVTLEEGLKRLL